jgi:hypothetical protein
MDFTLNNLQIPPGKCNPQLHTSSFLSFKSLQSPMRSIRLPLPLAKHHIGQTRHEKMRPTSKIKPLRTRTMDIERINQIGTQLADLGARTVELRGYL